MKLDKRHMAVSVVLLVGSIIYNVWVFTGSGAKKATPQASAPAAPLSTQPLANGTAPIDPGQVKPLPDIALDRVPEWPRNPFQNVRIPEEAVAVSDSVTPAVEIPDPDPVVATILYSSDRRAAVVNGRIVHIGDMVGTSKVVDIQPKAVIIDSPDRGQRTLELKAGSGTGSRASGAKAGAALPVEKAETAPSRGRK